MSGTPITHEQAEALFNASGFLDLSKVPPKHSPKHWTVAEAHYLASLVNQHGRHWATISVEMAKRDYFRTAAQCCSKYRALEEQAIKSLHKDDNNKRSKKAE